ncbi:MAG: mechanosensitive ion channel family protein [Campylobacter sp.]|nr:mechanosensitive ion channel family protein [Campylobacter sp.]
MRSLILAFILMLNLFAQDANSTSKNHVYDITKQIQQLNSQIRLLQAQSDSNLTANKSNLISLNDKKAELLDQIPSAIMQIVVKPKDLQKFQKHKAMLETNVARYEKSGNKKLYAKNAINLEAMKIGEAYFSTLIKLEEMFEKGSKVGGIKELLEEGLLNIQTDSYASINLLKENLGDLTLEFEAEFTKLEGFKLAAEEVLSYLKANADLLSSNLIFADINLKNALDFINDKLPFGNAKINFGKILLIVIIFVFFVSFTQILAKLTYWFISLFSKSNTNNNLKNQIMQIVRKPITCLLIVYALNICIGIAYYPTPTPIKIANIFSIIYIISVTWLVLTILNGYGMLFISELTKKSGRKEVVNLVLKFLYILIVIVAILMILARLGFDISAIIASLGIGGLAVAFAAKDIIANFFASVMLLLDNSFSQGDHIVCGSIEGVVVEIGLRNTSIRSFDNSLIFVPNSNLASEPIINWSRRHLGRAISLVIGLTYASKSEQIVKCIQDIKAMLASHPDISNAQDTESYKNQHAHLNFRRNIVSIDDLAGYKSEIFVNLDNLNASSIDIAIYCFTKSIVKNDYLQIKQDIILKVMQIVEQNGLSFAFPSQSLYVENSEIPLALCRKGNDILKKG